jgi:hypothetical protein
MPLLLLRGEGHFFSYKTASSWQTDKAGSGFIKQEICLKYIIKAVFD